jgi:hypothetical protein
MNMTKKRAMAIASAIVNLRNVITDEQALTVKVLYPEWTVDVNYKTGERVMHNGVMYRTLQDHTSQETWTPNEAVSLFTKVLIPDENVIYAWEQPDSTNPYMTGDKVTHNDKTWVSTIDNNVWEPGVYGWEQCEN